MKKILNLFYLAIAIFPLVGQADPLSSLDQAAGQAGLGTRDLTSVISLVINTLLGLLGTAFIVFIIIGGFKWMTSGGNTQRVEDAKKTITSAATGLAIVLLSYAIARFVIIALTQGSATGSTTTGG